MAQYLDEDFIKEISKDKNMLAKLFSLVVSSKESAAVLNNNNPRGTVSISTPMVSIGKKP